MRVYALLLALAVFAGCSRPGVPSAMRLRIVQTQDFPSLDPVFVSGVGGQELAALLYSYLVKIDDRGKLVPDAATVVPTRANGGISPDGKIITYHIRRGIRFSDGSPLTAFDVAETIGRVAFPGTDAPSRAAFDDVEAVATPDAFTVRVYLREPYAPAILYLCGPGNAVPILPRKLIARHAHLRGTALDAHPLGSGPYTLTRWNRGESLLLQANPHYFGGMPHIRQIELLIVPSSVTALEMLRTGEADAYVNADDSQYRDLAGLPHMRTEQVPIDGTGALIFNTQDPRLHDPRVRRALVMALDRRSIVDKTLLGNHRSDNPGGGLFQWAYDPHAYAMPPYDPRGAARLFDAAGWHLGPDGWRHNAGMTLSLGLLARSDKPSGVEMATQIQAAERAVGVKVTLQRIDVMSYVSPNGPLYGGRFQMALFPFIAGFDPDVSDQFGCRRVPPHGFNKSRYCNPHLDALMKAAAIPYERSARIARYRPVQRILARDLPMAALYQAVSINTFPADLQNERAAVTTPFWNVADWRL